MQRKRQTVLEGMIEEGTYTPSRYFDRLNQLGKVFTKTEREQLEAAAPGPSIANPGRAPAIPRDIKPPLAR